MMFLKILRDWFLCSIAFCFGVIFLVFIDTILICLLTNRDVPYVANKVRYLLIGAIYIGLWVSLEINNVWKVKK